MVGNFIGVKAGGGGHLLGGFIKTGGRRLVGNAQGAGGGKAGEGCPRLDGELIERHVALLLAQGPRKLVAPASDRLVRAGIDQVEGNPREGARGEPESGKRLACRVLPAERLQGGVVQRLHPDRGTVDPGRAVAGEIAAFGAGGIGFEGDLGAPVDAPQPGRRIDHGGNGGGRHQRWRAAAEEEARHGARSRLAAEPAELADQGIGKGGRVDRDMADMGIEVAIGAFGTAERPMDIEAERFGGSLGHGASAVPIRCRSPAKARARCDIACLASAAISPKVSASPSGLNIGS